MIESEEKRKRLTDAITRWCQHTQHTHLRSGDVSSLVGSILTEFYHITLCCGHLVGDSDEGVHIAFKDYIVDRSDMEHGGGEVSGLYCKECAEKYKKDLGAWEVKDGSSQAM